MGSTFDKGRALVIGIAEYQHAGRLPSSILNDAQDLGCLLKDTSYCGYLASNVRVLLDADATKANIVAGLQWLAQTSSAEDTVVVYFSGHGAQLQSGSEAGTYLCPVDFDGARLTETGLETDEFSSLIDAIPAARVAVMLDACHSAGAGVFKDVSWETFKWGFSRPALDKLGHGVGRVILASSTAEEVSMALGGMRNSLFTHFLLEGLKGRLQHRNDSVVRVLDLFSYVSVEVPKKAAQHPVLKANTQDNFPIALLKGGFKTAQSAQEEFHSYASSALDPNLESLFASLYPAGPTDSELWSRAGGDVAALKFGLSGRAAWHAAIRMVCQGGGGNAISLATLVAIALQDFPNNAELKGLNIAKGVML